MEYEGIELQLLWTIFPKPRVYRESLYLWGKGKVPVLSTIPRPHFMGLHWVCCYVDEWIDRKGKKGYCKLVVGEIEGRCGGSTQDKGGRRSELLYKAWEQMVHYVHLEASGPNCREERRLLLVELAATRGVCRSPWVVWEDFNTKGSQLKEVTVLILLELWSFKQS